MVMRLLIASARDAHAHDTSPAARGKRVVWHRLPNPYIIAGKYNYSLVVYLTCGLAQVAKTHTS